MEVIIEENDMYRPNSLTGMNEFLGSLSADKTINIFFFLFFKNFMVFFPTNFESEMFRMSLQKQEFAVRYTERITKENYASMQSSAASNRKEWSLGDDCHNRFSPDFLPSARTKSCCWLEWQEVTRNWLEQISSITWITRRIEQR